MEIEQTACELMFIEAILASKEYAYVVASYFPSRLPPIPQFCPLRPVTLTPVAGMAEERYSASPQTVSLLIFYSHHHRRDDEDDDGTMMMMVVMVVEVVLLAAVK